MVTVKRVQVDDWHITLFARFLQVDNWTDFWFPVFPRCRFRVLPTESIASFSSMSSIAFSLRARHNDAAQLQGPQPIWLPASCTVFSPFAYPIPPFWRPKAIVDLEDLRHPPAELRGQVSFAPPTSSSVFQIVAGHVDQDADVRSVRHLWMD